MSASDAYVLVQTTIVDSMVTAWGTASEDDTTVWASGAFTSGQERHRVETHRVYRRITDGTDAPGEYPENYPERWQNRRATNRIAMFDGEGATATTVASPLITVFKPGNFNGAYFAGVEGASLLEVVVKDETGGNVVFEFEDDLEGSEPGDWWEYWFMPFNARRDVVLSGIEPFLDAEVTVTLSGPGSVSLGILQVGDLRPIGTTEDRAQAAPKSYSYVAINADGKNEIRRGKKARDLQFTVFGDLDDANRVGATFEELNDLPCAWFASTDPQYEMLRSFGLGRATLIHQDGEYVANINVEGLI